ncbi:MAG: nucleoside 2-deoxyribosyltransferase [Alphaproteobacteria bacterium]|nr:nucleoside 2-deoxyribosyltransferase [Alphaproteobacteria bacterium]
MAVLYLAGPDVFLPQAREIGALKQQLCAGAGHEGLYPLDEDESVFGDPRAIFKANCALMDKADAGLFNLSPFRGPAADSGTVFELGYMAARGKGLIAYTAAQRPYADRVAEGFGPFIRNQGLPWDRDGLMVEDFGLMDNLMLTEAIAKNGGLFLTPQDVMPEDASAGPAPDLAAWPVFRAALRRLPEILG